MNAAASVRRMPFSLSALASLALALAVFGLWWVGLARPWSPVLPRQPELASPRITYLPGPDRQARALGSPVLFALPSELGFSGSPRVAPVTPQALRAAGGEPVLLARTTGLAADRHYLHGFAQTVEETGPGATFVPTAAPVFSLPAGATGFVLRLYWPDGMPPVRSGMPGAGVLASVLQDRPWELGALLEFDEQGTVQHVFIEKPTTSRERNEVVARALRAIRLDRGSAPTRSRLVVQYDQDGGSRVPPGGVARP